MEDIFWTPGGSVCADARVVHDKRNAAAVETNLRFISKQPLGPDYSRKWTLPETGAGNVLESEVAARPLSSPV
jgi:hypothetical protein